MRDADAAGDCTTVARLLAAGEKHSGRDALNNTPLSLAARGGHVAVCAMLLAAGADPQSADESRRSPLHEAAAGGHAATDDVLLYRSKDDVLYASVRAAPGAAAWAAPAKTDMPNDNSNINAGALPDGRRYLFANAMPFAIRDPLVVATSADGAAWDTARVAITCTDLPSSNCTARFAGKYKNPGPSYPQAVAVPALGAVFVVATNNKEDVVVTRLPLESL